MCRFVVDLSACAFVLTARVPIVFAHSRRDIVEKLVPDLMYIIQQQQQQQQQQPGAQQQDPQVREDAVFILGEWAWLHDVQVPTRDPRTGSASFQELSLFAISLLTQLAAGDRSPHVRLAAAQALGNYAAVTASRFGQLTSMNKVCY